MKRVIITLSVSILLAPASCEAVRAAADEYPLSHALEIQGIIAPEKFVVGDCDGDGWDELVVCGPPQEGTTDRFLRYLFDRGTMTAKWQHNLHTGRISGVLTADLDQDAHPEILLACQSEDSVWIDIYDPALPELLRKSVVIHTPDRDGSGRWDGRFHIHTCADLDQDGVLDIICSLNAGFDRVPRGITVISGATGEIIGSFKTASPIGKVRVCELDDPAMKIILLSTVAADNDHREGIFSDDQAYLCALDAGCNFIWGNRTVPYSKTWDYELIDLDSDDIPEVIFSKEMEGAPPGRPYRLEVRDIEKGTIRKYRDLRLEMISILAGDLDRDTKPEIVATLKDGNIQLLNSNLDVIKTRVEESPVVVKWMGDIDLNGEQEIVTILGSSTLSVLDRELTQIAVHQFSDRIRKVDYALSGESSSYLLVFARELTAFKLRRAHTAVVGALNDPSFGKVLWAAAGLLLGAGFGAWIVFHRVKSKKLGRRTLRSKRLHEELVSSLSAFGHSGVARSNLDRMALYCGAVPEPGDPRDTEYKQRLGSIMRTFKDFTRGLLEQIVVLCSEQGEWKSTTSRLRRSIDTLDRLIPSGEISVSPGKGFHGEAEDISSNAGVILKELRSLRRSIMRMYRTDTLGTVCRVVAASRERLADLGVSSLSVVSRGDGLAQVDEECLKTCLEILFNNAAEAMEQSKEHKMEVTVGRIEEHVLIEVTDTGCGIEKDDWEKIWERGITTKGPDHGLGLYHARQSLEKYDGKIWIKSSLPGQGTTIAVRLQAAETAEPASWQGPKGEKVGA